MVADLEECKQGALEVWVREEFIVPESPERAECSSSVPTYGKTKTQLHSRLACIAYSWRTLIWIHF